MFVLVFFEIIPERPILSIPIKPEEEHNIAVPTSCGFSTLLTQKKEVQEYQEKQNRRRILIVDDEPDTTVAFENALRDRGFKQVNTINDPLLALKSFEAGSYDLLVIDIVMPEIDGFKLYEEIRKINNKVKVCFITAFEVNYQRMAICCLAWLSSSTKNY